MKTTQKILLCGLVSLSVISLPARADDGTKRLIGGIAAGLVGMAINEANSQDDARSSESIQQNEQKPSARFLPVETVRHVASESGINSDYLDEVNVAKDIASKSLDAGTTMQIQQYDARGYKLMTSHREVLRLAESEYTDCQSIEDNYYTVRQILNVPNATDRIAQSVIYCENLDREHSYQSNFNFTPLGRLYEANIQIWSEENSDEILETFMNKLEDQIVDYKCTAKNKTGCLRWHAEYNGKHSKVQLSYDNKKKFKDAVYTYLYTLSVSSKLLKDIDTSAMKQSLERNSKPPKETKL